jgi:hypothetical protein
MAAPWEKYQATKSKDETGPWSKFQKTEPPPAPDRSFEVPTPQNLVADRARPAQPSQPKGMGERAQEAAGNVFPMARSFSRRGAAEMLGPSISAVTTTGGALVGTPLGPAGVVTGAGLGYGIGEEITRRIRGDQPTAPSQTIRDIATGATLEAGGRGVLAPAVEKVIKKTAGGISKIPDLFDFSRQRAAKLARESFETPESLAAGRKALQSAAATGEDLTAQQALARGGVIAPLTQATISRATGRTIPTQQAIREAEQEAARTTALQGITPDIKSAINTRRSVSTPLYNKAFKTSIPIDDELVSLFERMPRGTLRQAKELAKIEKRPFEIAMDGNISGENLHYIKRALGDIAYGTPGATAIGADARTAVRNLLNEYLQVVETKIPSYKAARNTYSDLSKPVNQAQVLKEMVSVLEKPGGGERIGPFLNVLGRGEEAMLRRAGGRGAPRYEALSEVLTPDQLRVVKDVAKQLETNVAVKGQVSAGEQKLADFLKEELPNLRVPNIFSVLVTTVNKFLELLGARVGKETIAKLANSAQSAKTFDELLSVLPLSERNKLLATMNDPKTWEQARQITGGYMAGITSELTSPSLDIDRMGGITNVSPRLGAQDATR